MSARTRARRRALELLFESEARGIALGDIVALRSDDPAYPMKEYAVEIVDGVAAHADEIDELIRTYSRGWEIDRMPGVDRALLRLASWEILHNDTVDAPVAISEARALAKEFSTDDSPAFVAGVLSKIAGLDD
ncbi:MULTISPECIES: transcription antitermination factor NusB [Brevibacterium]|uniref:Transcription antitermination protein NusB n=1 Tax=Brevibacterium salitolerans TaxID=1403566 RepID=A0ABP5I1R6_9MICO|nr:transcription antitermination factor NusB [Brevibacterium sp.]